MTKALALTGRDALILAGQMANEYADGDLFNDFNGRKADNTLRAYRRLGQLCGVLREATGGAVTVTAEALQTAPAPWEGVTWGLVTAFKQWILTHGDSTGTINRKISTIKVYAKLAAEAGAIDGVDAAKIGSRVKGYKKKEAPKVDIQRKAAGTPTRSGAKKAVNVLLTAAQVQRRSKEQPDTPQGRRDALLMALLLDLGLRVGEVAALTVGAFQTAEDGGGLVVRFYRPKVNIQQTHRLSEDARRAWVRYLQHDAPSGADDLLFKQSVKGGALTVGDSGMTERNLSGRVCTLGKRIGVKGLSAHDCRHSWATRAVAAGTDAFTLRDAGGWASLDMPSRYVAAAAIANDRVKLGR